MSRRGRDGRNSTTNRIVSRHANKRLACAVCGLPWMRDRIEMWVMQLHFELWHDTEKINLIVIEKNTPIDVPEPIDMASSQEIQQTLEKIAAATTEAKLATSEAHVATRDLKHTVKESMREIRMMIEEEVERHTGVMADQIDAEMRTHVSAVINRLEADWRSKLGLS